MVPILIPLRTTIVTNICCANTSNTYADRSEGYMLIGVRGILLIGVRDILLIGVRGIC